MGGAQSGPFAACMHGGPGRLPNGAQLVSVVQRGSLTTQENVWEVEVPAGATIADLKAQIDELYEVPRQMQRLSRTTDASGAPLEDDSRVDALGSPPRVHLQSILPGLDALGLGGLPMPFGLGMGPMAPPNPEQQAAMRTSMQAMFGAAQESIEVQRVLEESLKDVTYQLYFQRPQSAGGSAAGKKVCLSVDALALLGDVLQMVELELFGSTGAELAYLVFQGQPLPPMVSVHHAGIVDGSTVEVAKEAPQLAGLDQLFGMLGVPGVVSEQRGRNPPPPEQMLQQLSMLFGGVGGAGGALPPGGADPAQLQALLAGLIPGAAPGTAVPSVGSPIAVAPAAARPAAPGTRR
mmetsp:Transcript_11086/g.25199  ORF Transcript_11086/g.25199 Transcript_11086/m.25199 type:complete len:350 (-) Transcript_11086:146-1195(-)